jgi:integrase
MRCGPACAARAFEAERGADAGPGAAKRRRLIYIWLDMRHTCATLLAALDVHPRVAMRILRHAQIDVTMNVYTEVSDAKTLNALKRLGRQLGS